MNEALVLRESAKVFDYSQIPVQARTSLQGAARKLNLLAREVAVDLWEMGQLLAGAQTRLSAYGNGTFGKWLKQEAGISRTTAWRLMQVYHSFDRSKLEQTSFASSALYFLSEPSTPPQARSEALRRATNGETITHERAQAIVRSFQPPRPLLPQKPDLPPMPDAPEYRAFERDELMPRLHDAGMPDAPQMLSGQREEALSCASEESQERARLSLRQEILATLRGVDTNDEEALEACVVEMLGLLAQHNSISIAARFGAELERGPRTLSDLVAVAAWVCNVHLDGKDRNVFLNWRKRVLRLIDAITCGGGLPIYEHQLGNKQICYSLLEDPPSCP